MASAKAKIRIVPVSRNPKRKTGSMKSVRKLNKKHAPRRAKVTRVKRNPYRAHYIFAHGTNGKTYYLSADGERFGTQKKYAWEFPNRFQAKMAFDRYRSRISQNPKLRDAGITT